MSDKSMCLIVSLLLTLMLATVLIVAANIEAVGRIEVLERTVDAVIDTQKKAIKRIDTQFQTMLEADRENMEKVKALDSHVDFFLTGKWK